MSEIFPSTNAGPFGRRLKRARGAKVPVTVLTGFLGAGKTTLLKHFLETPEGAGTAVVINEFGATPIDDALVRASTDETVLIGNGCLCCVARSDLQETLRGLLIERERGELPDFKRIVIETSGLADPSPILQTFATDRALGNAFYLDLVLTVADAATGVATLEWSPEARKQAILADRIIVTKTDIDGGEALRARLRALNANAEILDAVSGAIDPKCFTEPGDGARNPFVAEAEHSDGIASFVLTQESPMAWNVWLRAMDTLMAMRGGDLLRVKGFLSVEGCAGPVVVQFVQHLAHPPVELTAWPDDSRHSRVVFITRGVMEKQVKELFEAVKALAL
ncbi:MAG: GTP-binding protein [Pseudolabrys sp.]|nr:GTP-binding protein [Pseudolabrys sp.]MDP2297755.1 GTP-binding protein [Pseudolabrys sp.]